MVDCCCCCIPVRLGTIILAIIALVIAITGAVGYLGKPDEVSVGMNHGLALFFGLLFVLMALISIFGIIGSLFSSPGALRLFEWMLWGFVLSYVVISAATIYSLIQNRQLAIDRCVNDLQNETDKTLGQFNSDNSIVSDVTNPTTGAINDKLAGNFPELCKQKERVKIWIKVIIALAVTLFGAYFACVASRFSEQIRPRAKPLHRSVSPHDFKPKEGLPANLPEHH